MAIDACHDLIRAGRVHVSVVWIDMLEDDGAGSALAASKGFLALPQVIHFHDPDRAIGKQVATGIGAPGRTAWDFYLIYGRGPEWTAFPPVPSGWFHQLREDEWAKPERFRWGIDLGTAIRSALEEALRNRDA